MLRWYGLNPTQLSLLTDKIQTWIYSNFWKILLYFPHVSVASHTIDLQYFRHHLSMQMWTIYFNDHDNKNKNNRLFYWYSDRMWICRDCTVFVFFSAEVKLNWIPTDFYLMSSKYWSEMLFDCMTLLHNSYFLRFIEIHELRVAPHNTKVRLELYW